MTGFEIALNALCMLRRANNLSLSVSTIAAALLGSGAASAQNVRPLDRPPDLRRLSDYDRQVLAHYKGMKGTFDCHDFEEVKFTAEVDVDRLQVTVIRKDMIYEYTDGATKLDEALGTGFFKITYHDRVSLELTPATQKTGYLRWEVYTTRGGVSVRADSGSLNLTTGRFNAIGLNPVPITDPHHVTDGSCVLRK
jgi:hypothetical protein